MARVSCLTLTIYRSNSAPMATKDDFENHCWQGLYPPEIYDLYAPYRRETGLKGRCGLLLIDLYNLVYEGGPRPVMELYHDHPSSCGEYAWNALAPTKRLLHAMREHSLPVLYSTKELRNQGSGVKVSATNRQRGRAAADAYEIHPELAPEPGELVIPKERASCFFGTPLVTYLQKLRVETLIIVGESTSGCVRATAADSYSYGFHTVLVEDGVFDRNWTSHQASLFDLHHKYADVMRSDEVIAQL